MTKSLRNLWIWTSFFFSFFFAFPQLISDAPVHFFKYFIFGLIGFGAVFGLLFWIAGKYGEQIRRTLSSLLFCKDGKKRRDRLFFWGMFALLILAWLPSFLAFFPGIFGADAPKQLAMVNGDQPFTNHHPWLHTLLIGWSVKLGGSLFGSPNLGVAFYVFVFQIVFCAYGLSRAMQYLYRKGIRAWVLIVCSLLMALSPFNQILVSYTTKDIVFTPALLLFVVSLCELCFPAGTDQKTTGWYFRRSAAVVFYGTLMSMFRSQGIYMLAVGVVLIFLTQIRHLAKRKTQFLLGSQVIALVLSWVMVSGVPSWMGFSIVNPREAVALPLQQIASILTKESTPGNDRVDAGTEALAYSYYDGFKPENLDVFSADNAKDLAYNEKIAEDPVAFLKLYLKMIKADPKEAIRSAAYLMAPYFDMRLSHYNGLIIIPSYTEYSESQGVYSDSQSLLPGYKQALRHCAEQIIVSDDWAQGYGWLSLTDPALVLYLLIFLLGWGLFGRSNMIKLSVLYPVLYVLTMMLGPVSLLRYSFIYAFEWPFLIGIALLAALKKDGSEAQSSSSASRTKAKKRKTAKHAA